MNPITTAIGFIPLVLFSLLDGRISVVLAAAIGTVAAIIVVGVMVRRAFPTLPIVQAVTLAAISALAYAGGPGTQDFLTDYGRGIASLVLAAFILITVGFAPFTATFARAGVPREHWASPRFIDLNRRISTVWGLAVLVLGITHLLYGAVGSSLPRRQALLLDWGPTVIAVIFALRYTRRSIAEAQTGEATPSQSPQGH